MFIWFENKRKVGSYAFVIDSLVKYLLQYNQFWFSLWYWSIYILLYRWGKIRWNAKRLAFYCCYFHSKRTIYEKLQEPTSFYVISFLPQLHGRMNKRKDLHRNLKILPPAELTSQIFLPSRKIWLKTAFYTTVRGEKILSVK